MTQAACPLCTDLGGALVFQGDRFRVIRAQELGFPAFYRVVWSAHVAEFSDLDLVDRTRCMAVVHEVETALRAHLRPTKINLATLGNMVAHLHWHVLARFDWDSHYPAPVWGAAQRPLDPVALAAIQARLTGVDEAIKTGLQAWAQSL